MTPAMTPIEATQHWLERAVIGLNLCPFAKAVHGKQQIRWVHSVARDADALLVELVHELQTLAAADPDLIDTTVLVHPHALADFFAFNDFLAVADAALEQMGLEGEIQIASLHPQYQFEGSAPGDIENFSNRSPHPTLHLLREASIEHALAALPDAAAIYERNIETLKRLGHSGWARLGIGPGTL